MSSSNVWITENSGESWQEVPLIKDSTATLIKLFALNDSTIFIGSTINNYPRKTELFRSSNGGHSFSSVVLSCDFRDLHGFGEAVCLVGVDRSIWLSSNSGKTFEQTSTSLIVPSSSLSIAGQISLKNMLIHVEDPIYSDVAVSNDRGETWHRMGLSFKGGLNMRVHLFSPQKGVAFDLSKLMVTEDGGITWREEKMKFDFVPNNPGVNYVQFLDENIWYASASTEDDSACLIKTTNGGKNWEIIKKGEFLQGIQFISEKVGYYSAGEWNEYYKTVNGGLTWTRQIITNPDSSYSQIQFVTQEVGFAVVANTILSKTLDGGKTWNTINNLPFSEPYLRIPLRLFSFQSKDIGYFSRENELFQTTDGGNSWHSLGSSKLEGEINNLSLSNDFIFVMHAYNGTLTKYMLNIPPNRPHIPDAGVASGCVRLSRPGEFRVDSTNGYQYEWSLSSDDKITSIMNKAFVLWNNPGIYNVKVTAINGCGRSESNELTIQVRQRPQVPIFDETELNPCPEKSYSYSLNVISDVKFEWYLPSEAGIINAVSNQVRIVFKKPGGQRYYLKANVFDGYCPSDTISLPIDIRTFPDKPIISRNLNNPLPLTSSSVINNQWYYNNKPISGANQQVYIANRGTGYYKVAVFNDCGTTESDSLRITVTSLTNNLVVNNLVRIFPNPSSSLITIVPSPPDYGSFIKLYDLRGQLIDYFPINETIHYDVSKLPPGIYILRLTTYSGFVTSYKLFIE